MRANLIYIAQTKRSLKSRLMVHKRCIKYQRPDQSAFCEHSMTMDHKIDWENTIILKLETDYEGHSKNTRNSPVTRVPARKNVF